jgi:hypothetical protein
MLAYYNTKAFCGQERKGDSVIREEERELAGWKT